MKVPYLNFRRLAKTLFPRATNTYKHACGHVLVIGGDYGYAGAVVLAGLAALRVGAGLVTIATRGEHVAGLNAVHPELMARGISDDDALLPLLRAATTVVLGPGLGRSAWSESLFACAIHVEKPLVIDGDGLYFVAQQKLSGNDSILTPHPGEAGVLLGCTSQIIQQDRLLATRELIATYNATVVLKGAGTLVGGMHSEIAKCKFGNPGMATAGMGDVLSGVIAGLLTQGMTPDSAARLGVCVHAKAGDLAARNGMRGLIASDLLPYVRELVQ